MSRLSFGAYAREKLVRGARILSRAVGCTLGPGGRVVIMEDRFGKPIVTKDGVSVARAVHLADAHEHMGASLLADAALKVADEAGDGTSTCVVMASELLFQATRMVTAGANPAELAAQMDQAFRLAENTIMSNSLAVAGDPRFAALVAHVSGNGDERVTNVVANAYKHVGTNGVILLEEGSGDRVELHLQDGFRIHKGWPQDALAPADHDRIEIQEAMVLIASRTIWHAEDIMRCIQHAAQHDRGLLIVCENLVGDALETVVGNCRNADFQAAVVRPHGYGDKQWQFMHDLALWCGGRVQDKETGWLVPEDMGVVARVEQARDWTLLNGPTNNKGQLEARISQLDHIVATTTDQYDRDKAVERLGRLRGSIASIKAGAPTPSEAREVKDRVEDALNAARVAYRDGIQPGGGIALWRASEMVGFDEGATCLSRAMRAPAQRIARNAGTEPSVFAQAMDQRTEWAWGSDAYGEVCNMLSLPDPTAVVVSALRAAVSTVRTLLLAEAAVTLSEDPT